ncbi:unnamed protein product [Polarella glacialis]|uniref:Uncharacterized protein n=1 Tax=Polarella glacialis TaxID=89957 RepID=A0A813GB06_POLGL|nr:unnamed protein product [Polarella glacialis]
MSSMPSLKPTRAPACKLRFRFCDVASPGYFPLRLAEPVSADVNIIAAAIQRPASDDRRCRTSRRVAKAVAKRILLPPGQILRHSNFSELLQMSEASFDGPLLAMPTIPSLGDACDRLIEFASLMPTDLVQSAGNVFITEFTACTQLPGTTLGQLIRSLMTDGCNLRLRTLERRDYTIYQRRTRKLALHHFEPLLVCVPRTGFEVLGVKLVAKLDQFPLCLQAVTRPKRIFISLSSLASYARHSLELEVVDSPLTGILVDHAEWQNADASKGLPMREGKQSSVQHEQGPTIFSPTSGCDGIWEEDLPAHHVFAAACILPSTLNGRTW